MTLIEDYGWVTMKRVQSNHEEIEQNAPGLEHPSQIFYKDSQS